MDLEVLVPPPLSGRVTPGAHDAAVSVDGFGNRFAVARKETAQRVVGLDQRARALVRAAPWQWISTDDGASWDNVETLPRGADALLPEGTSFDVASSGPTTFFASATPAGVVVVTVAATGRGKIGSISHSVYPSLGPATELRLAAVPGGAFLVVGDAAGTSVQRLRTEAAAAPTGTRVDGTACSAAASGEAQRGRLVVACLSDAGVVLHTSTDGGRAFASRVLGSADTRGGDAGEPSADVASDGTAYVLSGTRLWRITAGGKTSVQDIAGEGGEHRVTTLAVSHLGRVGVVAYRRIGTTAPWHVVVTVFTPGRRPVWSDFAGHDPASPGGASAPPSDRLTADFDPLGRVQVLWTATHLHDTRLDQPLLRNVWAVRSVSS